MDSQALADAWGACPAELRDGIAEFWPPSEWAKAAAVAQLESGFDPFALNDTTDPGHPCGSYIGTSFGIRISAERSVGYFQINSCNWPDWEWQRLYNARHNAGTAHMIWDSQGWSAWFFSAKSLGLL
jgi:hypothetical protein